ncbi:MAG: single-stranded DNA-binding protein [Deltaproteobacteria bacterium]|nr:single-stranded DNA-binding protein [Deltaproteobacteria bacterium]
MSDAILDGLVKEAKRLSDAMESMTFAPPVAFVYNPLEYAFNVHEAYIRAYGSGPKKTILLGMNPGPWGMAQVGVPFGEIAAVRDWMKLTGDVKSPAKTHQKRPVDGFACSKSEVSGRRLWSGIAALYSDARDFFKDHFAVNYCPLLFLEEGARNRTPDKLPKEERAAVEKACDAHFLAVCDLLQPERVIGVGAWAKKCATRALADRDVVIGSILHPSPASPRANRGWAKAALEDLEKQKFPIFLSDAL